jgi:hypothetical protein
VRGKSQIEERPSMGGAHREREKTDVAASILAAPTCLWQSVRTRCKGGSVEIVCDPIAGETVKGGNGSDSGRSTHFIADTAMQEGGRAVRVWPREGKGGGEEKGGGRHGRMARR